MQQAVLIVHVLISAALIGLVLIQHGKGADAGAAFGSGASGTVFGSRGSSSFLTKITAVLAAGFFITSLSLAILGGKHTQPTSVVDQTPATQSNQESSAPAAPETPDQGQQETGAPAPAAPQPPAQQK